jgi:signal transduction histidine kinase
MEPFFTTKPAGKGTGQGLPLARRIVEERHGGALSFESRVGEGTRFRIVFPACDEEE